MDAAEPALQTSRVSCRLRDKGAKKTVSLHVKTVSWGADDSSLFSRTVPFQIVA
jgi:hypothetical protein